MSGVDDTRRCAGPGRMNGHTFGGHALDRYVFEFDPDDEGGGATDVPSYDDVVAAMDGAAGDVSPAPLDDLGLEDADLDDVGGDEVDAYLASFEAAGADDDQDAQETISAMVDEFAPGLDPQTVVDQAEAIIDEVEQHTGLAGEELVAATLQVAAEIMREQGQARAQGVLDSYQAESMLRHEQASAEARAEWQLANAEATLQNLLGDVDASVDRGKLAARMDELLEPMRKATGAGGSELVRAAVLQAAEDLSPSVDYDVAHARAVRAAKLGLPPLVRSPRRIGDAERARADEHRIDSDDYDVVEKQIRKQTTGHR